MGPALIWRLIAVAGPSGTIRSGTLQNLREVQQEYILPSIALKRLYDAIVNYNTCRFWISPEMQVRCVYDTETTQKQEKRRDSDAKTTQGREKRRNSDAETTQERGKRRNSDAGNRHNGGK